MSRYSGRQRKHAAREAKELRRVEADERNVLTKPENRRQYRLHPPVATEEVPVSEPSKPSSRPVRKGRKEGRNRKYAR